MTTYDLDAFRRYNSGVARARHAHETEPIFSPSWPCVRCTGFTYKPDAVCVTCQVELAEEEAE